MRERDNNLAIISSVLLHIVVVFLLIVGFEFSSPMIVLENVHNNSRIISAMAVNEPQPAPKPMVPAPPPPPPQLAPPPKPLPPKPLPLPTPVIQPAAIAIKPPPKKLLPPPKALLQKQLLDDLKSATAKPHPARAKAIEKAMEKELKAQAAKSLQQQLFQEEQRASNARSEGEVNKYKALILQAIGRRWIVPASTPKTIYAELLIRLAPSGMVLDVQISKSSGDVTLDRSARAAVFKASPLPVPEDTNSFEQFRQFVLKMKPEDVVVNEQGEV
ncbi:MAG: cell envelope integrity protein TolA [Pseudomonadota bacterium]